MTTTQLQEYRRRLAQLFSGYRAEWLDEKIFELFTEPAYFPQLTTSHPCFLEGGRGTGKTTVLRCLSYQGQAALHYNEDREPHNLPYVGMYYRVNTNRVKAFAGAELDEHKWIHMFAHYINIEFCEAITQFLVWYSRYSPNASAISKAALASVSTTLHLDVPDTLDDFCSRLNLSKLRFEAAVNNIGDAGRLPALSLQGAPIDALMAQVKDLQQFRDIPFFFLIDEYENLDPPQQRVLNTLIKHCGEFYSFKVGVRELGFRERSTLNVSEQLTSPADYKLINIARALEGRFSEFAARVCGLRLQQVMGEDAPPDLETMLPELSPEDEAIKLGVDHATASAVQELRKEDADRGEFTTWLSTAAPLEIFVLISRAAQEGVSNGQKLRRILADPQAWDRHYGNHKYGYLFAIRRGKAGIRKYYAGWRVYCLLAATNIRYLLELVDQALSRHFDEGLTPLRPIPHELQTLVAQETGQRNLRELEGLSLSGARLTRLLLGVGRIFQVMAADPVGHTPEVNQFCLTPDVDDHGHRDQVTELLTDAVMNLALLRHSGSKLQEQTDIRQFDYTVHPIFSPFFVFSHRRKRKIRLSDQDVLDLVNQPTAAIARVVGGQNRTVGRADGALDELPEQMELFKDYYAAT